MADVFISYARSDRQIAEAISKQLGALGVSTFFDAQNIVPGDDIQKKIEGHVPKSKAIIVIWSEQSARSLFVREEIRVALDAWENGRLFLVKLDNADLPVGLRDIYGHDYSGVQPDKVAASIASDVLELLSPPREAAVNVGGEPTEVLSEGPHPQSLPSVPEWKRKHFPTWIKYFIAISILLWLGSGIFYYQKWPSHSLPEDGISPTALAISFLLCGSFAPNPLLPTGGTGYSVFNL